jgi:Lantibiotic dehydratase, N terminus
LIALSSAWSLWPDFALRSAGFPVSLLEILAMPNALPLVRELEELSGSLAQALEERSATTSGKEGKRVWRWRKRLLRDGIESLLPALASEPDLAPLVERAAAIAERLPDTFDQDREAVIARLADAFGGSRLREAVTWQNHGAARLLHAKLSHERAKRRREAVGTAVTYLQRYTLKNDTAGFFGPFVWGRFEPTEGSTIAPGPTTVRTADVFLEYWVISALADRICEDRAVRQYLAPRINPTMRWSGEALVTPFGGMPVSPARAALLAEIDGDRTARAIAEGLVGQGAVTTAEEALDELERAANEGQVIWSPDLPNRDALYGDNLRQRLAAMPDDERRAILTPLTRLEQARDAALSAVGDAETVEQALIVLDGIVEEVTGGKAARRAGEMYAGRTASHLHCTRDLSVNLGKEIVQRLRPLTLVGASLRHLSQQTAQAYGVVLGGIYDRIRTEIGRDEVPMGRFWMEAMPHFMVDPVTGPPMISRGVVEDFERRWGEVVGVVEGGPNVELSHEELAPRVAAAFDAEGPGWPSARIHSPDVMLVASGPEAIEEGDFQLVLGEVHPFVCSVETELFSSGHPDGERFREVMRGWYPQGRVVFAMPPSAPGRHLLTPLSGFALDVFLEVPGGCRSSAPSRRTLRVADLNVRMHEGQLMIESHDGAFSWTGLDFLNNTILPVVGFAPSTWSEVPRITIDGMILSRRKWRRRAEELAFARLSTDVERWRGARAWARAGGLPARLFYKSPKEVKPIYLDLDSPHLVDVFCRLVRKLAPEQRLSLSELLPGPEGCWLPDREGGRYASEIRLVIRDEAAVAAPLMEEP